MIMISAVLLKKCFPVCVCVCVCMCKCVHMCMCVHMCVCIHVYFQRGSPCQDPAGNWTTRRPPDHRKETQTAVVRSCLPFVRSGKTILQCTVKGRRRQGGQRKRWEDNIREWTGLEFGKFQKAVENRKIWREKKLVAKSSVKPQRPSWLRD